MDEDLLALSSAVGQALKERGLLLACAESCTGGWVAEVVTATSGSSNWFERGFVCYSNAAKQEMLGVRAETLTACGAVSEETAQEMAAGALKHSHAHLALAITGIAGPDGGTPDTPVGTVCFAWSRVDRKLAPANETCRFSGNREQIRRQAVMHALNGILSLLDA